MWGVHSWTLTILVLAIYLLMYSSVRQNFMSPDIVFDERVMWGVNTYMAKFVHRSGGRDPCAFSPKALR